MTEDFTAIQELIRRGKLLDRFAGEERAGGCDLHHPVTGIETRHRDVG